MGILNQGSEPAQDLLHVTIYKDDDEAFEIWRKVLGPRSNPITLVGRKDTRSMGAQVRAAPVLKFTSTWEKNSAAVGQIALPDATATAFWNFGT